MARINKIEAFNGDYETAKQAHKIANNTFERMDGDDRVIRLHNTDIIRFKPGGSVVLDSGGWQTVTTKERMNLLSGYSITQEKGLWSVGRSGGDTVPYFDGITLPGAFNNKPVDTAPAVKLLKDIVKLVKLLDDGIPRPDGGDCWLCHADQNIEPGGTSLSGPEHLQNHVDEQYMHGALIWAALKWSGYSDPGFMFSMDVKTSIKSAVRRYLRRQLGLPN